MYRQKYFDLYLSWLLSSSLKSGGVRSGVQGGSELERRVHSFDNVCFMVISVEIAKIAMFENLYVPLILMFRESRGRLN